MEYTVRNLVFLCCLVSFITFASPKSSVILESGEVVNNCNEYNKYRQYSRVKETINNQIAAGEYLECSLISTLETRSGYNIILKEMLSNIRVRQLPLSVGPRAGRKDKLNTLFSLSGEDSLLFEENDHHIRLRIKGLMSKDVYLVWVSDEILNATYRSYYPALMHVAGNKFKVSPYYQSGF